MEKNPGGMKLIIGLVLIATVIGFAIQTGQLVSDLYPGNAMFMKVMSVLAFDGFYVFWTLVRMFWTCKSKATADMATVMFWVSFGGSALASFVEMIIFAGMHMHFLIDNIYLWICYAAVTGVTIGNVVCLVIFVDVEYRLSVNKTSIHLQLADVKKN